MHDGDFLNGSFGSYIQCSIAPTYNVARKMAPTYVGMYLALKRLVCTNVQVLERLVWPIYEQSLHYNTTCTFFPVCSSATLNTQLAQVVWTISQFKAVKAILNVHLTKRTQMPKPQYYTMGIFVCIFRWLMGIALSVFWSYGTGLVVSYNSTSRKGWSLQQPQICPSVQCKDF